MSKKKQSVPDLSKLAEARKLEELFGFDVDHLQPTEITAIKEVMVMAKRDFVSGNYFNTVADLNKWAIKTDHAFQAIGFHAFIDPFNVEVDDNNRPYFEPIFNVTGRVKPVEFDHDQARTEVQSGLLDGTPGKVNDKGVWLDT